VLGQGLEEQLETFLSEHLDTVLVIIDILQMIQDTGYDNTYAHGIAILLIHHLRIEENVWGLVSDSEDQIKNQEDRIVPLLSDLMSSCTERHLRKRGLLSPSAAATGSVSLEEAIRYQNGG